MCVCVCAHMHTHMQALSVFKPFSVSWTSVNVLQHISKESYFLARLITLQWGIFINFEFTTY